MASIIEEVGSARTYMQLGLGMGVYLVLDELMHAIEHGQLACVADVVSWVRDSQARLEEHCGC